MKCLAIFALVCVALAAAEFYDEEGSGDLSCKQEYKQCRENADSFGDKRECRRQYHRCRRGEVKDCLKECREEFKECRSQEDASILKCGYEQFKCRAKCPFSL
ncbi:uncharacterized protein [Clytia hemisphaerica]